MTYPYMPVKKMYLKPIDGNGTFKKEHKKITHQASCKIKLEKQS